MTELSPAAQAVLDAYYNPGIYKNTYALAAALRAAVEQCTYRTILSAERILAIAAELEAQ